MTYAEEDYLQLSGIQHYCFCKRQWGLINLEQVWLEDGRTVAGRIMHRNVDVPSHRVEKGVRSVRALQVSSSVLGLSGICDVVEFHHADSTLDSNAATFEIHPVEYKVGHRKTHDCDKIQLCAQAMALEEMYRVSIKQGSLYYGQEHRRLIVDFEESLRQRTCNLADEMHDVFHTGRLPSAILSEYCKRCSLFNLCMPLDAHLDVDCYMEENMR